MKQGFEERQIARAKVIFSARLPSSAGFFLLRFLIRKPNPLQQQNPNWLELVVWTLTGNHPGPQYNPALGQLS